MNHFIFICIMLMVSGVAEATSRMTALSVELMNLGYFIQIYHDQNGDFPQTWDQLEKTTPGLDGTLSILKPTKRMVMLSPPIELPRKYRNGKAIAMTRESFRPKSWKQIPHLGITYEYLQEPKYVFIISNDGGAYQLYVSPDEAKSILDAIGMTLPKPSGLGQFSYEKEFMMHRLIIWSVALTFGSLLIWRFIRIRYPKSEQAAPRNR